MYNYDKHISDNNNNSVISGYNLTDTQYSRQCREDLFDEGNTTLFFNSVDLTLLLMVLISTDTLKLVR